MFINFDIDKEAHNDDCNLYIHTYGTVSLNDNQFLKIPKGLSLSQFKKHIIDLSEIENPHTLVFDQSLEDAYLYYSKLNDHAD